MWFRRKATAAAVDAIGFKSGEITVTFRNALGAQMKVSMPHAVAGELLDAIAIVLNAARPDS